MPKNVVDYAVYQDEKVRVEHHYWETPEELSVYLYKDGESSIQNQIQRMAIHHLDDRRYITMAGEGSRKSNSLWSWRLLELRAPHECGMPMNSTFDSIVERHFAPVIFMDKEYSDGDREITFTAFRPGDAKHFDLSHVGYLVQNGLIEQAKLIGKGELPTKRLD